MDEIEEKVDGFLIFFSQLYKADEGQRFILEGADWKRILPEVVSSWRDLLKNRRFVNPRNIKITGS